MPPRACGWRHYVVGLGCLSIQITFFFEREGKTGRGWSRLIKKKISQGGHMGGFNKYVFLGSFFHLTQYCSLCGLHLFTGGEGQAVGGIKANLIFLPGGCGGFKTNLNKQLGGVKANYYFFFITSVWITFFSNGRVRQEDGMIRPIK